MGSTKVVDLGYYDRDTMWPFSNLTGVSTYDLDSIKLYFDDLKTRMSNAGLDDGLNWQLSKWGYSSETSNASYSSGFMALVIRKLDGAGNETGHEWLLLFPLYLPAGGSYVSNYYYSLGTTTTIALDYFMNKTASAQNGSFFVHYNSYGLTDSYALTTSGVDYQSLLLRTNFVSFMPSVSANPLGSSLYSNSSQSESTLQLVFNYDETFIGLVQFENTANRSVSDHFGSCVFAGQIIEPKRTGDSYTAGTFYSVIGAFPDCESTSYCAVSTQQDDGTVLTACNTEVTDVFSRGNQPYYNGSEYVFQREKVIIYMGSYIKGYLKKSMFPVQGANNRNFLSMFKSELGVAVKINSNICIPWADDVPAMFSGWPLSPQRPKYI